MAATANKLTQDQTKRHNQRLLLKVIYDGGTVSRAESARVTGLTRTTASNGVAELLETGLITELGPGPSAGGKPPTLVQVVDDARLVLALDLAGYAVRGCLCDLRGRLLACVTHSLAGCRGQAAVDVLLTVVATLQQQAARPLLGVGVGVPGLLDLDRGRVVQSLHLGWNDLPLADVLSARTGLPVHLVNDSQAAALAHFVFANPERAHHLAVIHVGRGVSAGLVLGGRLHQGSELSGASEIGHVRVLEDGPPCVCGHRGCLEAVASQDALLQQVQAVAGGPADGWQWASLVASYHAGDPAVRQLVANAVQHLGTAVANLVGILRVPHVVLTGPVTDFGPQLAEEVRAAMAERVLASLAAPARVTMSALGDNAVAQGAAALVLAQELGIV